MLIVLTHFLVTEIAKLYLENENMEHLQEIVRSKTNDELVNMIYDIDEWSIYMLRHGESNCKHAIYYQSI